MENAAKALMLAAGVLIGILILSLGIYLYDVIDNYVSTSRAQVEEKEVKKFNEQFLKLANRTDLTIQDVISIRNVALNINKGYSSYSILSSKATEENYYVDVFFKRVSSTKTIFDEDDEDNNTANLLREYMTVNDIKCTVTISPVTQRVYKVVFE